MKLGGKSNVKMKGKKGEAKSQKRRKQNNIEER